MVLIAHRGNINGKTDRENSPEYIDEAIELGYDVEVDVRYIDGKLYLGHDSGKYETDLDWLGNRVKYLWIHCKNHQAMEFFWRVDPKGDLFNYFWHDSDDMTLTSKGFIWAHPKIVALKNSIAVIPEVRNSDVSQCLGVCSDNIKKYKNAK